MTSNAGHYGRVEHLHRIGVVQGRKPRPPCFLPCGLLINPDPPKGSQQSHSPSWSCRSPSPPASPSPHMSSRALTSSEGIGQPPVLLASVNSHRCRPCGRPSSLAAPADCEAHCQSPVPRWVPGSSRGKERLEWLWQPSHHAQRLRLLSGQHLARQLRRWR